MSDHIPPSHEKAPVAYAGFWVRFVAWCVDAMILGIISFVIQSSLGHNPLEVLKAESFEELRTLQKELNGPQNTLLALFGGFLTILFWVHYNGATPGKKLMGIKVTKVDGSPLSYVTGIIRYIGYFLSSIIFGLGYLWVGWDAKRQGWHDKIASTVVVYTNGKRHTVLGIFLALLYIIGTIVLTAVIAAQAFTAEIDKARRGDTGKSDSYAQRLTEDSIKEDNDKILSFVPTECGLSVPVPKTTDTVDGVTREWLYEEIDIDGGDFYVLDQDVYSTPVAKATAIGYKPNTSRLESDENGMIFLGAPGLNMICVDNTKGLSLEEFKGLALANKTYKVQMNDLTYWGEVAVYPLTLEGTDPSGQPFKDIAYIGVSQDENKLLYMRLWSVAENDTNKRAIEEDISLIVRDLRYRDSDGSIKQNSDPRKEKNVQGVTTKFFDTVKIKK